MTSLRPVETRSLRWAGAIRPGRVDSARIPHAVEDTDWAVAVRFALVDLVGQTGERRRMGPLFREARLSAPASAGTPVDWQSCCRRPGKGVERAKGLTAVGPGASLPLWPRHV